MTLNSGPLGLSKRRVSDQGVGPDRQRQLGAGIGERFLVLFRVIEQNRELALNSSKSFRSFKKKL